MHKTRLGSLLACVLVACVACDGGEEGGSGGPGSSGSGGDAPGSGGAGAGGAGTGGAGTGGGSAGCAPALPTFADGKAPTATLHVQAGAPAGGDGSAASPFNALITAIQAATPGTEVRVSGELPELTYTTDVHGTAEAPIWITGEAGAKIGPLTLQDASHVVAQDLELSGSPDGHVLHFFSADNLLFRRLRIHDAGLGCIKGSQATSAYVEDSELWAAGLAGTGHPILEARGLPLRRQHRGGRAGGRGLAQRRPGEPRARQRRRSQRLPEAGRAQLVGRHPPGHGALDP